MTKYQVAAVAAVMLSGAFLVNIFPGTIPGFMYGAAVAFSAAYTTQFDHLPKK